MENNNSYFIKKHFLLTSSIALVASLIILSVFIFSTFDKMPPIPHMQMGYFSILESTTSLEQKNELIYQMQEVFKKDPVFALEKANREELIQKIQEKNLNQVEVLRRVEEKGKYSQRGFEVLQIGGDEYLVLWFKAPKRMHPLTITIIIVILVVILTTVLSTALTYRSFGKFYLNAKGVIEKIKSGDFDARFEISRKDEIGQSMFAFNEMAQEIEKYVHKIKSTEVARIRILQELAHDLRTPIASLKNTVFTLKSKRNKMSDEQVEEFFELAENEIHYFQKLVEDLLFLAKMSEPKYEVSRTEMNVTDLIREEVDRAGKISEKVNIQFENALAKENLIVDPHLFKRLIRNALENASSFARSAVTCRAWNSEGAVNIEITDDGPGFSEQVLKDFGKRKISRFESGEMKDGRVSVGLGSVIMSTIADLHQGSIHVENVEEEGQSKGGKVFIKIGDFS